MEAIKSFEDSNGVTLKSDGVMAIVTRKSDEDYLDKDGIPCSMLKRLSGHISGRATKSYPFNPDLLKEAIDIFAASDEIVTVDVLEIEHGAMIVISSSLESIGLMSIDPKTFDDSFTFKPFRIGKAW